MYNKLTILLIALFISLTSLSVVSAQQLNDTDFDVMIQSGHIIKKYTLTNNERFVITTDYTSVALWDLRKRKIINKIPIRAREVYAHPVNPRYACVVPYDKFASRMDYFLVYDMITEQEVDRIEKSRACQLKTMTADMTLELKDGVVDIYITDSKEYVGSLDGTPTALSGDLDINKDNGLLLVTGISPMIWDVSQMTATNPIDYYAYLKEISSSGNIVLSNVYSPPIKAGSEDNTYGWGWKQTTSGRFEQDGTIRICGYDGDISYWNSNGLLEKIVKTPMCNGPVFTIQKYGNNYAAATFYGLFTANGTLKLKANEYFNNMLGRFRVIYDLTPPFHNGKFLVACDNSKVVMGDMNNSTFYDVFMTTSSAVMGVRIDDAEKQALIFGESELLREAFLEDPSKQIEYHAHLGGHRINVAAYLPDNIIAAGTSKGQLGFWKRGNSTALKVESSHQTEVIDLEVASDMKRFYSLDKSGTIIIWDVATLKPVMYMHSLDSGDYLYITPDNYYTGSKGIYDKVHFVNGVQVYSFEQFDLAYNRPDIVYQRLFGTDGKYDLLRKAWERRIHRMGFDPKNIYADTHVPTVKITNAKTFPHLTSDREITLKIYAKDTKYKLARIILRVNGVPVDSRLGIDISSQGVSEFTWEKTLQLAAGRNHIDVSCINEKGIESYNTEMSIWCDKPKKEPSIYLAVVGVSEYLEQAYNLGYASKDAEDFKSMILKHCSTSFGEIKVHCITDKQATLDNVRKLKNFYEGADVDDVAMLFYAGHGVLDSDMNYYLATHDMDFSAPAVRGWSYDEFEDILDGIRPMAKYCFIDACHSGKIIKEEFEEDNTRMVESGTVKFRGSGTSMSITEQAKAINEAIQSLFTDFTKGNGSTVLSSSNGMEVAIEDDQVANGLFTYAIKRGIENHMADMDHDGIIYMSELAEYVSNSVSELSGGVQTPGMRVENKYIKHKLFK